MGFVESHAHLLPFVDDGVRTKDVSLAQLRAYADAGFSHVVTTPHVYNPSVTTRTKNIRLMYEWARAEAGKLGINLMLGGEIYMGGAIDPQVIPFFDGCVLIEGDVTTEPLFLMNQAYALSKRGYTVILAHIERYHWFDLHSSAAQKLREIGVYFQVNVDGIESGTAQRYLDHDMVDIIASDNHGDETLPKRLSTLLETYPFINQRMMKLFGLNR